MNLFVALFYVLIDAVHLEKSLDLELNYLSLNKCILLQSCKFDRKINIDFLSLESELKSQIDLLFSSAILYHPARLILDKLQKLSHVVNFLLLHASENFQAKLDYLQNKILE